MKVIVASANPVKVEAVRRAFGQVFEEAITVVSQPAESEVSDQPMSDNETLRGARRRVENAMSDYPKADYWVGIEGGVQVKNNSVDAFGWVYISNGNQTGHSRSATFTLPARIASQLKMGLELGGLMDRLFQKDNSKQKAGAIGLLTKGHLSRRDLYLPAVLAALIPFLNPELYAPA